MDYEEIQHQIALLEIEGIGATIARKLIDHFGSAKEIFKQPNNLLNTLKTIGPKLIYAKRNKDLFVAIEKEISYCERNNIQILSISNDNYPKRLKDCSDAPIIMYYKGKELLNNPKIISIVGTRAATSYGKEICNSIVKELSLMICYCVSSI